MEINMARNSSGYRFTVINMDCTEVQDIKRQVKIHNAQAKLIELQTDIKQARQRLRIRPRLGKNSPFRHLYAVGGPLKNYTLQDIRPEHGARFDVYVYTASID